METYPLQQMTVEQAIDYQFKIVSMIAEIFQDNTIFQLGDVGIAPTWQKPHTTAKVEQVYAKLFGVEACQFIVGAGTQAIRYGLMAMLTAGEKIFVHDAPIYPTTKTTLASMQIATVAVDVHDIAEIDTIVAEHPDIKVALLQHSRQKMSDHYDLATVIEQFGKHGIATLVDDNYVVSKVPRIGVELAATISTFSCFKLLGPEGVGCIVGEQAMIANVAHFNYSGGSQVQGWQALEALRQLVYTPVAFAIQAQVIDAICARLNAGELTEVYLARIANAQSRVILVQLQVPIALAVIQKAPQFGATNYPVGAESKYECMPMFYRLSGTFLSDQPHLAAYTIRINPMRAGADLVISILKKALSLALKEATR